MQRRSARKKKGLLFESTVSVFSANVKVCCWSEFLDEEECEKEKEFLDGVGP